jgi:outer membrane protein
MTYSLLPNRTVVTVVLLTACLLFGLAQTTQAQPKIAMVDLEKVFTNYYKTKQADGQLKDRAQEADKQYKGMLEDYQKANDDYKKLVESANDQAVSSEERDRRKKSAESKVMELNEIEKSLTQFRREKQATFDEQMARIREQIVREIREVVNKLARDGGYTMVVDSSAKSGNTRVPFVLFSSGQNDLTDEVLSRVNAGAPPGFLDADKGKADLKLSLPETDKEKEKPAKRR